AMIGRLPNTLRDRAIVISMRRKLPNETVEKLGGKGKLTRYTELALIAQRVARFAADNRDRLRQADPAVPRELNDSAADSWTPLLAIAEVAGGTWPDRARIAAAALSSSAASSESQSVLLLGDLRDLFEQAPSWTRSDGKKLKRLSSKQIVEKLGAMEERPWSEYGRACKPITQRQLAKLLGGFNIIPNTVQLSDGTIAKGYDLEDLADTFSRYLPDLADRNRQIVKTIRTQEETAFSLSVKPEGLNGSEKTISSYGDKALNGSSDGKCQTAPDAGEERWEI